MKRFALFLLLVLASPVWAGPTDAVVRMPSHGGSATIIATGDGWTYVLSCSHCFPGGDRNKPVALDVPHPSPGEPRKVGISVVAVANMQEYDLSLLKMNIGPVPYVSPVAPVGHRPDGECWSVGFDEMKFPVTLKGAKIVGQRGPDYLTDNRPWHGRSGGALIEKKTGFLIGVTSAYSGPRNHQDYHPGAHGIYVSLPSIHRFLAKVGVMKVDPNALPDVGSPSPFVQPQQQQRQQPRPQPFAAPGGH